MPLFHRHHEATTLTELLKEATIRDVASTHSVVVLPDNSTLEEALSALRNKNILSAPVASSTSGDILGLVDVNDVVVAAYSTKFREDLGVTQDTNKHFWSFTVKELINESGRNPCSPQPLGFSLSHLIHVLSQGSSRVPVYDGEKIKLRGMASQMDIAKFLCKPEHLKLAGQLEFVLLETLLDSNPPEVLTTSDPVHKFFTTMRLQGVSSMGVVDANGKLVANMSASNLRGLKDFEDLKLTAQEFLSKTGELKIPVALTRGGNVLEATKLMVQHHVHRIWVLDQDGKPEGVFSLSDLMSVLKGIVGE
eukprot:TRINITY_DN66726_c7_g2_i2.p1 TRINITY_DN66726_c7_g2~~TRINITY_DN66726_c7_g2_i2.p1  ORF type:complete len:307 (-),score=43.25 TRINITY_DN66726_c7_g2_i2:309-1229(-)